MVKKTISMKLRIGLLFFFVLILIIRFPKRRVLTSPLQDGKCITIFRPFQFFWQNHYYIIPYRFSGIFKSPNNYFCIEPMAEQKMSVDWTPSNYQLAIQLPFCGEIQKVIYKIDTSKYHIAKYCGSNIEYIIPSEPRFYDRKRYSLFSLNEWLP